MAGVVIPDPRGGHVWVYGVDAGGDPVKVLVDTSGHLQVDGLSTANPTNLDIALSALRDALTTSAPTGNDLADLYTRLGSILTELEDVPKHANFDIHPITKHLGVAVDESVLPTDAATQTTLAAILAAQVNPAATPVVYNVTMTTAATEYNQALPSSTKKFLIKCRTLYDVKLCFTSGQSGTTYITVPAGMSYYEDLIQPATLTLYVQCATAAQVAEIVAWS